MRRRTFLSAIPAVGLLASVPFAARSQTSSGWRTFEVVSRVEVMPPAGQVRTWIPVPMTQETDYYQFISNTWNGNAEKIEMLVDPADRAPMVVATFKPAESAPWSEVTSRFRVRDRMVDYSAAGAGMPASAAEQAYYLKATESIPTDGIVLDTASKITVGAKTDVEKARAIYEWMVESTYRNPTTRGCGIGDIRILLETGDLGGKCADLNGLFVGLARASGIPARDVYGVRVADSRRGYKSLGRAGDISKAQHCRAEFYAQNIGWVPVDPADVRKVVLEENPGLTLNDEVVKRARATLFGNWEGNWLPYNYAHDVKLPGSTKSRVAFLMYPQAENAEGRVDSLDPDNFKYKLVSREIV